MPTEHVPQISTAVSDALLAVSAFHACTRLATQSLTAVTGFLLVGLAASLGVHRFGAKDPSPTAVRNHKYLSWLASVLGMACIAAAYYRHNNIPMMANVHLAAALALVILKHRLTEDVLSKVTEAVSSVAVVSVFIVSLVTFNPYGLIGSVIYALAGLVIGDEGRMMGMPRVDLFHYALVLGNIALMMGLTQDQQPVYYRPSYSS